MTALDRDMGFPDVDGLFMGFAHGSVVDGRGDTVEQVLSKATPGTVVRMEKPTYHALMETSRTKLHHYSFALAGDGNLLIWLGRQDDSHAYCRRLTAGEVETIPRGYRAEKMGHCTAGFPPAETPHSPEDRIRIYELFKRAFHEWDKKDPNKTCVAWMFHFSLLIQEEMRRIQTSDPPTP